MPLTAKQAISLGLVQGPAEVLPLSSSAHAELIPELLGWDRSGISDADRKTFQVALHAGSFVVLARAIKWPRPAAAVAMTAPAVVAGVALEDAIEQRLSGPVATAVGLIAGSLLLIAADSAAPAGDRDTGDLSLADAAVIGVVQAAALAPGLSRLGMATAAARLRGFSRADAALIAHSAGLPVGAGAVVLKSARAISRPPAPEMRAPLAAGAVAAAVATRLSLPLLRRTPIAGAALWRMLLAVATLHRRGFRQNGGR